MENALSVVAFSLCVILTVATFVAMHRAGLRQRRRTAFGRPVTAYAGDAFDRLEADLARQQQHRLARGK